jgi:intraflagellar transport protein 80
MKFCPQAQKVAVVKLGLMVDDAIWNDSHDILAAISDQKLIVWYYPHVAYVDKDLLKYVKVSMEW